jgi:hypothetical protein
VAFERDLTDLVQNLSQHISSPVGAAAPPRGGYSAS